MGICYLKIIDSGLINDYSCYQTPADTELIIQKKYKYIQKPGYNDYLAIYNITIFCFAIHCSGNQNIGFHSSITESETNFSGKLLKK